MTRPCIWSKYCAGMSYLESLIGLSLILILITVFLSRILSISAEVEQVGFERTLVSLRTELKLFTLQQLLAGRDNALQAYDGQNPMLVIKNIPSNYAGECDPAETETVAPGSWYFAIAEGLLIYRTSASQHLYVGEETLQEAKFRLKFFFEDSDNNGSYDNNVDRLQGLDLAPQDKYLWR